MKYRRLGRTGLRVSVIGVGTWQFGGEWGRAFTAVEATDVLGRAKELGINLIDTAECYGDHLSESLVGQAIRGDRSSWIVATKFGHRFNGKFERLQLWTADAVREQLDASLKALGTDYIDLYQFHSGTNESFDQAALWDMLQTQVKAGKIRHLGLSISPPDNIYQVSRSATAGASTVQVIYNRLDRAAEAAVLPSCQEQDLGVLARVPLASGFLTGKYKPGDDFTNPDDVRSRRAKEQVQARLAQADAIRQTEVPADVPMAAWALAWCLRHPAVTAVIPGCKSAAQVESNASAAALVADDHPQAITQL